MVGGGVDAARRGDDFTGDTHATEGTTDSIVAVSDLLDNLGDVHGSRAGLKAGKDVLTDRRERSWDGRQGIGTLGRRPAKVNRQPTNDGEARSVGTGEILWRYL